MASARPSLRGVGAKDFWKNYQGRTFSKIKGGLHFSGGPEQFRPKLQQNMNMYDKY